MKFLAINAGSSSLKWQLLSMPSEDVLAIGIFERIGIDGKVVLEVNDEKIKKNIDLPSHKEAIEILLNQLIDNKIITSFDEIDGVGHRVVHGGNAFTDSALIDDKTISTIESFNELAPLHNPANVLVIKELQNVLPTVPHVAVFDTSFHQTMPPESYLYPVPKSWVEEHSVRKYGFHGTSHKFITHAAAKILNKPVEEVNIINAHIGNGASICAIQNGKVLNTSMGFTPLDGLMMGTRSGSIDPSINAYMAKKLNTDAAGIDHILNKESGMAGMSGISSDMRDIENAIEEGNKEAIIANNVYNKRIIDTIVQYANQMQGKVDIISFTAGVGENGVDMRRDVLDAIHILDVNIDEKANNVRGKLAKISTEESTVQAYVIPTNEELMIVKEVLRVAAL